MEAAFLGNEHDPIDQHQTLVSHDMFSSILGRYASDRVRLEALSTHMLETVADSSLLELFYQGNLDRREQPLTVNITKIFDIEGAVKALDARYWSEVITLTDMSRLMPADRREEWRDSIQRLETPAFTEDNVRATLVSLASQRSSFFAEKIDGVFQALSREHVTNRPEGFSKRLITYVHYGDGCILSSTGNIERLQDLRSVIATLMQRDEPPHWVTTELLRNLHRNSRFGEWVEVDGGAFAIRLYRKGTCHVRVHADIAWQLNRALASRYPSAIPARHRTRPFRAAKARYAAVDQPLPFAVLHLLDRSSVFSTGDFWSVSLPVRQGSVMGARHVEQLALEVLEALGGTPHSKCPLGRTFDYNPKALLQELQVRGTLPEQRTHQFYPTPAGLAETLVEAAEIGPGDRVLEPSAGVGHIARLLPVNQTQCVELAPLHCEALRSRGLSVDQEDFLAWANRAGNQRAYHRIVANPPFADGRAVAHLDAMLMCLRPQGRLSALVPAALQRRWVPALPVRAITWHSVDARAFPGVNIEMARVVVSL